MRTRWLGNSEGFSLIEVFVVLVMTMTLAAMMVPRTVSLFAHLRLSGDARSLSNSIALAKMRAAADFTRARLRANIAARTFVVERFQKTGAPGWVAEGNPEPLAYLVNLSTGGLATPPANTQPAIAQAPACLDNAGAAIASTACIVFNSRGIPVDNAGLPTGLGALYITDGTAVYGITVAATGLIRVWKSGPNQAVWTRQ
jgi:Tfp pilus assembly protein FimT